MEVELLKKINLKGIKAGLVSANLTDEKEFAFIQKCVKVVKDFSGQVAQPGNKTFGLMDFFLKNIEKYFKPKGAEEEISQFVSAFALHSFPEVALFADLFANNITIKTAKVFVKFVAQMQELNPYLYESKQKLLKNIKLELKKALHIGSQVLRDDFSVNNFSRALSTHFENSRSASQYLTADLVARFVVSAYIISHNYIEKAKRNEPAVLLTWNSRDPHVFDIEVNRGPASPDKAPRADEPAVREEAQPNLFDKLNANYKKALRLEKQKDKPRDASPRRADKEAMDANIIKICHDYVFDDKTTGPEIELMRDDENIDKQLIFLRSKLEKQRAEYELQKSLWKLVMSNSKSAIRNYRDLKGEIVAVEGLVDGLMNVIDKNTDEWRHLFMIKNNHLDELRKYKFFVAAILENCSQELQHDFREFQFAHEEDKTKMDALFNRRHDFDLHEYLTDVYQNGATNINLSDLTSKIDRSEKPDAAPAAHVVQKVAGEPGPKRDHYDSLVKKLDNFNNRKEDEAAAAQNSAAPAPFDQEEQPEEADQHRAAVPEPEHEEDEAAREERRNKLQENLDRMKKKLVHTSNYPKKPKSPSPAKKPAERESPSPENIREKDLFSRDPNEKIGDSKLDSKLDAKAKNNQGFKEIKLHGDRAEPKEVKEIKKTEKKEPRPKPVSPSPAAIANAHIKNEISIKQKSEAEKKRAASPKPANPPPAVKVTKF